jgi:hypothetical protein
MIAEENLKKVKTEPQAAHSVPLQPKVAPKTATEEKYSDAALVCCCDLRWLFVICC